MTDVPTVPFHDGQQIPQLGLGVWQVEDDVAADVVEQAIRAGYRHIDTAAIYGNEEGVGRAVAAAGVPREELFITTKVWNSAHGYDEALAALDGGLGDQDVGHGGVEDGLGQHALDLHAQAAGAGARALGAARDRGQSAPREPQPRRVRLEERRVLARQAVAGFRQDALQLGPR